MNSDLKQLRKKCPLPVLMLGLGLGRYAKSSCSSPFRLDSNASWGIFESDGNWLYKDFTTGEWGDEIAFLAQVHQLDQKRDFLRLLDLYKDQAKSASGPTVSIMGDRATSKERPDTSFLASGSDQQLKQLSELRGISLAGLRHASDREVLKFGNWHGNEVFSVMDGSGCLAELRRLDGKRFDGYGSLGPHKSHTLKNSRKSWPLGILEATDCPGVALVEGMPDFLAIHQFIVEEEMVGKVSPVAMLTSSCDIATEALEFFAGRSVRIFPHFDRAGIDGAERWQKQLITAKARQVDFFNFRTSEFAAGVEVKDLCDFNQHRGAAGNQPQILKGILL